MEFVLKITLDNAAFEGRNGPYELAEIIRRVASFIHTDGEFYSASGELRAGVNDYVRDSNGNTVGRAEITGERESGE